MNTSSNSLSSKSAAFLVAASLILIAGCRTAVQVLPPPGPAISAPSAAVVNITATPATGNAGDFEVDLIVVDSNGHPVSNLDPSAITIAHALDTLFTPAGISTALTTSVGPYSAELLLDQTGSIRMTDPLNLRLIAARLFLDATGVLNSSDEIQLSTFQDSLHVDGKWLHSYGPFTHNTAAFEDTVETLADKVGGGTPLYDAMYFDADSVAQKGANSNKALVVFTDGEDNESQFYYPGATLWNAIDHAVAEHVRVFAIALETGLDTALISAAMHTGGAVMHASDAKQMVSYFGAMSSMLHGGVTYYKTKWHVSLPASSQIRGKIISGSINIRLKDNETTSAPFAVEFP